MRDLFEEWLVRQMGDHVKAYFNEFSEDGYADNNINCMWLGFNAGVELADHL